MLIAIVRKWIAKLFRRPQLSDAIDATPNDTPSIVDRKPREPREKIQHDNSQAHFYMGDLLKQLDMYFADLEYLRRGNPEMASVFEKIGVGLCSSSRKLFTVIEPGFVQKMPATGCFYFGRHDTDDTMCLRFLYFLKKARPVNVQFSNHTVYEIGGVFGIKERHFFRFHISVDALGCVRALKEIQPSTHFVGKGSRRNGGHYKAPIVRMEWVYPSLLYTYVSEAKKRTGSDWSVDDIVEELFSFCVNGALHGELDMNVRVKKNGKTASFSINMLRTPYFFSDREKTKNEKGTTVPILHIVRPHFRNGKAIKAHWRGERRFMWNGYSVSIGMPGKHFKPLSDLTAAAWDEAEAERFSMKKLISLESAAKRIDSALSGEGSNAA
jgi:hypothetical protein